MTAQISITDDFDACKALRFKVFVDEQNVPADIEVDEFDPISTHLLATDGGIAVGTARFFPDGNRMRIGRVCVLPNYRGTGLGSQLIRACVKEIVKQNKDIHIILVAQTSAMAFYEKLGFTATGPIYESAGIDHQDMIKAPA